VYVEAFGTAAMLYICPVRAGHCVIDPFIGPGVAGVGKMLTVTEAQVETPQVGVSHRA
jgi:hypothetical protein